MAVAVILLSLLLIFFMALTSAVERSIRALGLLRFRDREAPTGTPAQNLILLGIYLRRLNAAFLLAVAVYLITSRASAWYYGVAVVALCWIGSLLMGATARLRPGSAEMVALLVADLERRRAWYRAAHDTARLDAVEDLLRRVRSIPGVRTAPGLHR
jgi:hypothetical protein